MDSGAAKGLIRLDRSADIFKSCALQERVECMFPSTADSVPQELGTELICLMTRASLAFHLYAREHNRIAEVFLTFSCEKSIPVKNVNGGDTYS